MTREEWTEIWEREYLDVPLEDWLMGYGINWDTVNWDALAEWDTLRDLLDVDALDFYQAAMVDGKSDLATIKALENTIQRVRFLPKVAECALTGDWEEFTTGVHMIKETMLEAFLYFYEDMPAEYRRDFVVGCYDSHGDSLDLCRQALIELPCRGLEELPEEYRDQDQITVYRAGEEPLDQAADRISWTLDLDKARWFRDEYIWKHAKHLYQAHIRPCDVIAYSNDREESEVMQYQSVYDVEEID